MEKITKSKLAILIATIIYLIVFTILFLGRKNYEFMVYVVAIAVVMILIFLLDLKFKFSTGILLGLSLVGLMHMLGGYWIIDGLRVYGHYFIFGLLKYDWIMHFLGVYFGVLLCYEMLKPLLDKKLKKIGFALTLLLFLIGIGIGGLHEIIEFFIVLTLPETGIGLYKNTMLDMVYNGVGTIFAIIWINLRKKFSNN